LPSDNLLLAYAREVPTQLFEENRENRQKKRNSPVPLVRYYDLGVESIGPLDQPTLARKLGDIAHVSPLWHKVRQMSGCLDDRVLEWMLKCAVQRGASHYEREFAIDLPPDNAELRNEELGVALCLGQHPYNSVFIRAAAQLLSSSTTDVARLARLAVMERVEPILLHIAAVAHRFDPGSQPWAYLRQHLPPRRLPPSDVLPHWSRFVSQTGVAPFGGGPNIKWLRRREPPAH
jgi:hypothetical protein